jgi:hypothetical protein
MTMNAPTSPTEARRIHTVCVPISQRDESAGSLPLYQHVSLTAHLFQTQDQIQILRFGCLERVQM